MRLIQLSLILISSVKSFSILQKSFKITASSRALLRVEMLGDYFDIRTIKSKVLGGTVGFALGLSLTLPVFARPEGVNRPDLLPSTYVSVIDIANFLRY